MNTPTAHLSAYSLVLVLLITGLSHCYGQALDAPIPDDATFSITTRELLPAGATRKDSNPLSAFLVTSKVNQAINVPEAPSRGPADYPRSVAPLQDPQAIVNAFDHLVNQTRPEDWRWPELGIGPASGWTTGSPTAVRRALQAVNLSAVSAMLSGNQDQALATFTSLAMFSDRIQRQPCGLAHLVVSTTALRMSEAHLERTLVMRHMGTTRLARLQQQLTIGELGVSDIQRAMRIDYTEFKESLPHLADPDDLLEYQYTRLLQPFAPLLLKPGATRTMRMEYDRTLLSALGRSWSEGLMVATDTQAKFVLATQPLSLRRLSVNPLGEYHHRQHLSKMQALLDEFAQCITAHRLTLIQIAIRRYELDHDGLPGQLDELVPKYLPSLPTDPFANAPMRWNPQKQALYSVGANRVDDGGTFRRTAAPNEADMGMLYWWGEPGGRRRNTPSDTIICPVVGRQ